MSKERTRVVIKEAQAKILLSGDPLTIRIPEGAKSVEIRLADGVRDRNWLAEVVDVFFNGRKAK